MHPLAFSGVCLISNRANPVPQLTRAQIQDIVAARVTSWSQIPGSMRTDPIVPVALPGHRRRAGLPLGVRRPGHAGAWQPMTLLTSTQVRDYVEQTPAALGYVDLALTEPVHTIAYEGVGCTRATIKDGRYPARRPLGVVTRGRRPAALTPGSCAGRGTARTARRVIATRYIPVR